MEDRGEEQRSPQLETRFAVAPITHVDVRDASGSHGFWTMSGYAAVYSTPTTLYDGRFLKLTEEIAPSAFDNVLRNQPMGQPDGVVHFNLGHDMNRSVAATDVPAGQPGSLQLRSDPQGLFFLAKVPSDDPDGVAMAAKMRSGVLRQASFAFTVASDNIEYSETEDGPDVEHRTITEIKQLYDVCATPQGAYSSTVVGLRSLAAAFGQTGEPVDHFPVSPSRETDPPVSPQGDGDSVKAPAELREALRRDIERRRRLRASWSDRKAS